MTLRALNPKWGLTIAEAQRALEKLLEPSLQPLDRDDRPVSEMPQLQVQVKGSNKSPQDRQKWWPESQPSQIGQCRAASKGDAEQYTPWHGLYSDITVDGVYDCLTPQGKVEQVPAMTRSRDWFVQNEENRRPDGVKPIYRSGYKDVPAERLQSQVHNYDFDPRRSDSPELRAWARRYFGD